MIIEHGRPILVRISRGGSEFTHLWVKGSTDFENIQFICPFDKEMNFTLDTASNCGQISAKLPGKRKEEEKKGGGGGEAKYHGRLMKAFRFVHHVQATHAEWHLHILQEQRVAGRRESTFIVNPPSRDKRMFTLFTLFPAFVKARRGNTW